MRQASNVEIWSTGPTGIDALEPLLTVSLDDRTAFYAACTPSQAEAVAEQLDEGLPTADADAVLTHETGPGTLPIPELSPLDVGRRSVLGPCGWVRPTEPEDYRAAGGFCAVSAAPDAISTAAQSVTGRGWGDAAADEPIGDTWDRVAEATEPPAVVVNAHGSPADGLLLESAPFLPLDGALAAARVVGADRIVVYLSVADERARDRITEARDALPSDESLPSVDVQIATGPDEYRAAEPTMALEAIEGSDRLEARLRPPGPECEGLFGRPTLVHTPRTLAQVVRAIDGDDPTRVLTVRGDGAATIELPEGASLSAARNAVAFEGQVKAACVGGQFGGLTPDLDVAASPEALDAAGLGMEGVIDLLGEDECIVAYVGEKSRYGKAENCGRCVPCREGSKQLTNLLREVYDGEYRPNGIRELLRVVRSTSLCGFGPDMTRPVETALDHFEAEFHAHADGRCPAGACTADLSREVVA
jgi:NADH-quinone oxidoreductase subunit F